MRGLVGILTVLLAGVCCAGCGSGGKAASTGATTTVATTPAATSTSNAAPASSSLSTANAPAIAIAPTAADQAACELLYARLQRVTSALTTSSELIAHSVNKKQLSGHIAIEREQLLRSAQLLTGGPVPAPLIPADRQLVAALVDFSDDFARAEVPARKGDYQAAVNAMGDKAVVQRNHAAATTNQNPRQ